MGWFPTSTFEKVPKSMSNTKLKVKCQGWIFFLNEKSLILALIRMSRHDFERIKAWNRECEWAGEISQTLLWLAGDVTQRSALLKGG